MPIPIGREQISALVAQPFRLYNPCQSREVAAPIEVGEENKEEQDQE